MRTKGTLKASASNIHNALSKTSGQFPITVAGDYLEKAKAFYPFPSYALRDFVDNFLAPGLERNTPCHGGARHVPCCQAAPCMHSPAVFLHVNTLL